MKNIKEKFEFEVSLEYEGMRLDKYLSEQIDEATRSYLEKLIDYLKMVVGDIIEDVNIEF